MSRHGSSDSVLPTSKSDPMSSSNPYATTSSQPKGYPVKKSRKKLWWGLGALLVIGIIVGAVLGGVLGTRNKNNNSSTARDKAGAGTDNSGGDSNGSGGTGSADGNGNGAGPNNNEGGATATDSSGRPTALPSLLAVLQDTQDKDYRVGSNGVTYLPLATDTNRLPIYATGVATAGYSAPTTAAADNKGWPSDDSTPSASSLRSHPRLYAPKFKWDALTGGLIAADPYLSKWNESIIRNATDSLPADPVKYFMDGGSGILDNAREVKLRVKNWAYAYKITGKTEFGERIYKELENAVQWTNGTDQWNSRHFLDTAELTNAYAIAYDWLYDFWSTTRRDTIRGWIVDYGLKFGAEAYSGSGWWTGVSPGKGSEIINGNWNCVCNAGLLAGALAIYDDDTTNTATSAFIDLLIEGSKANCFKGAYSDGTWAETPHYWYFGTTGAAEIVSLVTTAMGGSIDFETVNPGFKDTGLFHMYVTGMTYKFSWGDHGPNKYSATANSLFLWGDQFDNPAYALYQRDQNDAAEPYSMFWYNSAVDGAWWNGLAIDKDFSAEEAHWSTARSSWSDNSGTFWAMKAGKLQLHQTHGDLDIGDFVLDAMGQRWASDLGSDQYLGCDYFASEAQTAHRWEYYRKATVGQNTIVIGRENQRVDANPTVTFGSTGTKQGNMPSLSLATDDTAFMTIDMSSAYGNGVTANRGMRFLNGRTQILLQDEVSGAGSKPIMWRMTTNATVSIDDAGTTATLEVGNQTMKVLLLNAEPASLKFSTEKAQPTGTDPTSVTCATGNGTTGNGTTIPNINAEGKEQTVLIIENADGGSMHTEVLFNPQWSGKKDYVTPSSVALGSWDLKSHN